MFQRIRYLFLAFINDFPSAIANISVTHSYVFADDTKCIQQISSVPDIHQLQTWVDLEKKFRGGEPNIVGIKLAQLNVLLKLQLRTSLVVSKIPV